MNSPFFYISQFSPEARELELDEETSRHIVQVLRMKKGEKIQLTDGRGNLLTAEIIDDHKKHCRVSVIHSQCQVPSSRKISIGISLLKNASRFEWFLEKATEIGVSEIIPMICERTEKQKFKEARVQNILVSAMLQSQQCWLPELRAPVLFPSILNQPGYDQKFIAHCREEKKGNLSDLANNSLHAQLILIGPEGDFTKEEISQAITHHFIAVKLGETRLRTETAGVVAAIWLMAE